VTRSRTGLLALCAILAAGCGAPSLSAVPGASSTASTGSSEPSAAPTPEPTTHVLGLDWGKADVVEAPPGDALATTTPYKFPGSLGHPQHYQGGQADLLDVASTRHGLVAVGFLDKDISADAWLSADGRTWARILDFPAGEGSQAVAVTDGPHGIVAVGRAGTHAASWRSDDGQTWEPAADGPALHAATQIQMTAVTGTADGYAAVGYLGSLAGPIEARFWWSPDGRDWTLVGTDADVEASRAVAIVAAPDGGLVAVGATGDAKNADGSAAWTSPDGQSWTRVSSDALRDGVVRGITAAPGVGFLAVGSDASSTRAMVWRSPDGRTWEVAPDAASLDNFGLKIEMDDVAWDGTRFLAGGHRLFGTQFPTGLLWVSSDGLSWERANESAALSQGRISGVTAGGPGLVAVGTYGSPDFAIPTVWLSPP
jgi:hypothetical protein